MRILLQSLFVISVTFVYVAGPYLTVEMEHSHEVSHSHGHRHPGHDHNHSHHPHDHGSKPAPEVPDKGDPDGDPHSHTHVVSLGADTPFTAAPHRAFMANRTGACHPAAISEFVPDGPYFPLIKPPQLG